MTGYWPQHYYTTKATTNYIPANHNISTTVWYEWNQTSDPADLTWQNWNTSTTTGYYTQTSNTYYPTYTNHVWQQWVNMSYAPQVLTPEQVQAQRQLDEHYEAHRREEREKRQVARTRARLLLGEFLDDEQKAELDRHGRFHVTGSRGRRYCIRAEGQSGNVDLLKSDGSVQASLCAAPRGGLPEGDAWLMQMIEIRHDEDHFLHTANVHRGRLPALV